MRRSHHMALGYATLQAGGEKGSNMPLNEDDKAELVAYLDGELDESATQAVEAKIAADPDASAELDALKQTWGMLDYLPKSSPSPNFTNRTMERLTLEKVGGSKTMPMPWQGLGWLGALGWSMAVVSALGVGYLTMAYGFKPTPIPEPLPDPDAVVLAQHADWLEQLRQREPQAFQAIKSAPSASAKLTLINERRDFELIAAQPPSVRDQWDKLGREGKVQFLAKLRAEEREKHEQWVLAKRFWKELEGKKEIPCRRADYPGGKVKDYVENYLMPYLSAEEKTQLTNAEGRWPDYPRTLVEIASKRPSALPTPNTPREFALLPMPVQQRFKIEPKKPGGKPKLIKPLDNFKGPNFASHVVEIGLSTNKLPFGHEYLACNTNTLLVPMREFVDDKLMPAVKDHPADLRRFTDSEGKWPDYPLTIQELAKKYKLDPPWHYLPEPERWRWDAYRNLNCKSWGSEVAKEKKAP